MPIFASWANAIFLSLIRWEGSAIRLIESWAPENVWVGRTFRNHQVWWPSCYKQGNKSLKRWSDLPKVTWLVNVRTGNRINFPVFQPISAFSLHYPPHSINWLENKALMSPTLYFPWAKRIFNWERMCPNLWWETINTASAELLGHGQLFQQRPSVMGGRRWGRECCSFLFWKSFVSLLAVLVCQTWTSEVAEPKQSHHLPWFLSAAFGIW